MIIVIGHKNPDTDAVVSAIVWSNILNKKGEKAIPAIAGELNKETQYVLKEAQVETPQKKEKMRGEDVFLVDHHGKSQMIEGAINVIGVLDHHHLSGMTTDSPIYFRNEPVGSTSTLIFKVAKENNIELSKKEAFLLLCGIVSDTLKFNSPTSTKEDEEVAESLAEISEVDIEDLSESLFKEKSDLSGMSIKEIIINDYKNFDFSSKKVGIGVCETTEISFFEGKEGEIVKEMEEIKKEKELDYILFAVIDILGSNSLLYTPPGKEEDLIKRAFHLTISKNPVFLKGVTSRKKQIVPPVSEVLKQI